MSVAIGLCALLFGLLAASASAAPTAYVTDSASDNVAPIDVSTNAAGTAIPVGGSPAGIAITPSGATAYVANFDSDDVTPIDLDTNTAGTPIPVDSPRRIAITPDGKSAYVTNVGANTVTPIDLASNTPGTPIAVGDQPEGIAITPDGATAYVANSDSGDVTPIDLATNTAGTPIPVGESPNGIAITPNGATAYVVNLVSDEVTPIAVDTNTPGTPIALKDGAARSIAITPDGTTAYVTVPFANGFGAPGEVTPIDLTSNSVGTPIAAGDSPWSIAITPDGTTAYVTNLLGPAVTPIDLATGSAGTPIALGLAPEGIAITPTIAATPDRAQVDFGNRDVGAGPSGNETVRIESTGTGNLIAGAATLAGQSPGEFAITSDACAGTTLLPGDRCTIGVSFDPTSPGAKSASLEVPSNDPNRPTSVALAGTGTVPAPPPAPVSPPPAPTQANSVCNPAPTRTPGKKGTIRLSPQALAIQQRIDAAALRRLNAANVWINQGIVPTDLCAGSFGPGAFQAGINWVGGAPVDTTPPSPRALRIIKKKKRPANFTVSRRQVRINDTISRALFARARATEARIQTLTGGNLAQGAKLTGRPLWPGLATTGPLPASAESPATPLRIGTLPPAGRITVSAAQLRRTQRRSQQAIRIANRVNDRIPQGLTESQFRPGSIGSARLG